MPRDGPKYMFIEDPSEAKSVFGRQEVQEVTGIRECTDIPFLLLFAVAMALMYTLHQDAAHKGNIIRLFEPVDFEGKLCGFDEEVRDMPLGFYPSPYNDMIVCVHSCPKAAADGIYNMPDGPMGKFFARDTYPSNQVIGRNCLPLDFELAAALVTVKSAQAEIYRGLATVFSNRGVFIFSLVVPVVLTLVYLILLRFIPPAATVIACASCAMLLCLVAALVDLDKTMLKKLPLYVETHPLMLEIVPYTCQSMYMGSVAFAVFLFFQFRSGAINRATPIFRECIMWCLSFLYVVGFAFLFAFVKLMLIQVIVIDLSLLMSIIAPVEADIELLGQFEVVERTTYSPYYMKCILLYAFCSFWALEFLSYSNKYLTAQLLAGYYFLLPSIPKSEDESKVDKASRVPTRNDPGRPVLYAVSALVRFHLGTIAVVSLFSFPFRVLRFLFRLILPNRPNLKESPHNVDRALYYAFFPLVMLDFYALRLFNDSALVMTAVKGYGFLDAAHRAEGLMNRSRGKIPNLAKVISPMVWFLNQSVGVATMMVVYFFFRERQPKHTTTNPAQHVAGHVLELPQHSPLLVMPIMFFFGMWVGGALLQLVEMSSVVLSVAYCIDVEMAGGTETDALYVTKALAEVYKDMGGSESEREMAQAMSQPGAA